MATTDPISSLGHDRDLERPVLLSHDDDLAKVSDDCKSDDMFKNFRLWTKPGVQMNFREEHERHAQTRRSLLRIPLLYRKGNFDLSGGPLLGFSPVEWPLMRQWLLLDP